MNVSKWLFQFLTMGSHTLELALKVVSDSCEVLLNVSKWLFQFLTMGSHTLELAQKVVSDSCEVLLNVSKWLFQFLTMGSHTFLLVPCHFTIPLKLSTTANTVKAKNKLFSKKFTWISYNTKFYPDFESVEKSAAQDSVV